MPVTAIIGSGFSGLSAAAYLSAAGHDVHVFEKNQTVGGRARQWVTSEGYVFDMGPSWYWMPDVFDRFFNDFGYKASDFYQLRLLDPAFEMVFGAESIVVPSDYDALGQLFDRLEPGSAARLDRFMAEAEIKYRLGMEQLVYKPALSMWEFISLPVLRQAFQVNLFSSFRKHLRRYFTDSRLLALMEFPILFLGGTADTTPALYSLMNYAGLKLGTWYPEGGFGRVTESMKTIAESRGTRFHFQSPVQSVLEEKGRISGIISGTNVFPCDGLIASADYHHVENELIPGPSRNYKESYWRAKTFAPSCLIFYLGVKKKINRLGHHTLFFDEDIDRHAFEIYQSPQWPSNPLFYVCCPSRTDPTVAPEGHENLFLLMPVAAGLTDGEALRDTYYAMMMERLERFAGEPIRPFVEFKRSYSLDEFSADYNAYKGNAYGLANTWSQTAIWRPKIRNRQIRHFYYAGQLTVPGPGVPPAIISGKVAAALLHQSLSKS